MAIPEFHFFFSPVLETLRELGGSARPSEIVDEVASKCSITEKQQAETIPSGFPKFQKRVHWARFYLAKAGYIDSSRRGVWALTEKGRTAPNWTPEEARKMAKEIEHAYFPKEEGATVDVGPRPLPTSGESLAGLDQDEEGGHRQRLSQVLQNMPPAGFERVCQRLLREAGFEKVVVTGRSGDGGIDGHGLLQINPFVSFNVLFQCKRYAGAVSASQVRDFRGAMLGRADKGIVMTTGTFTKDARAEATRDGVPPIELVDGEALLDMCESLEFGLIPKTIYEVDRDFFEGFR